MFEQLTIGTIYAAVILLITLWALALLTRRVRKLQTVVEGLQQEFKLLNDAIETLDPAKLQRQAAAATAAKSRAVASELDASKVTPQISTSGLLSTGPAATPPPSTDGE